MSRRTISVSRNNRNNRYKSPARNTDPIIAQHSHFFSPRLPNKPGYYIFINPHLANSVSKKICRSITDIIVPNYDIQQVWMHPKDTVTQWGLKDIMSQKEGNKTHWIHETGTYFSKYDDKRGSAALFASVINRLRFENYISWGAQDDTEYYACGEYLNAAFFDHRNARRDCAFVMLHYTNNAKANKDRYEKFIEVVNEAIENQEDTYIQDFVQNPNVIKQWQNTSERRRKSSLRATFPQDSIFGNMINGGFLYVRDLNYSNGGDYLYIEGICASKFAGKAERRGNDKTLFKNGEKKIIVPHPRSREKKASPGLEFVDMTNIISYMSGYKGTKLSALIHVINFYFTKFNFKFLQQSIGNQILQDPEPYDNQEYVDQLVADLSKAGQDQAKTLEYQILFNKEGILKNSAHAHTWPERYHEDWRRRISRAKSKNLTIAPILEREYERYETHGIGEDGFNQYFIWDSFNLPILPEQRLTQVTKAIMADVKPGVYGYLLQAPQQQQQQPPESICDRGMKYVNDRCVAFGGGRRTKRKKKRRKNNKKRTKKRGRRRKGGKRTRRKRKKRRKSRK